MDTTNGDPISFLVALYLHASHEMVNVESSTEDPVACRKTLQDPLAKCGHFGALWSDSVANPLLSPGEVPSKLELATQAGLKP